MHRSLDGGTVLDSPAVKVLYYGLIRNLVGKAEEMVEPLDGATVRDLIEILTSNYGERFRDYLVTKGGTLHHNVRILVGDSDVVGADGLDTALSGASHVTFVVTVRQMTGG